MLNRLIFPTAVAAVVAFCPAPRLTARTEIPNAAQPQLTVAADGRVWLVYGQMETVAAPAKPPAGDHAQHGAKHDGHGPAAAKSRLGSIFVASSSDGGATFGPAEKVGPVPGLMLGMRRGPRLAAQGDRLTVTVIGEELFALTSADAGRTWSAPATINDVPKSAMEGLHDLAAAPDGKLFVTWLDLRNGQMELWGAESTDAGRTWGRNQRVYASPDKSICECCHPNALFDAQGNLAVMFRNSVGGARDMWMAVRSAGAREFAAAKKVGEGSWQLNACPMDGGKLVALGQGKFAAVWQRAGEVFFVPPGGAEIRLGKGKQPLAWTQAGSPVVLWQDGNDLVSLREPGRGGAAVKLAADARFAVAVALPGQQGAVIAYERGAPGDKQPGVVIERR
jgi:hypothetical protein